MTIDYTRRSYLGSAIQTTLNGTITAGTLTFAVNATTGWPDGTGGPFFVTIDPGLTSEEHMLVQSVSGTTITIAAGGRGKDNTTATTHQSGAIIYPSWSATDADTANAHYNDLADNHAQYLNTARHDISARHTFGAALGTRGTPVALGTALSSGSSSQLAAADHVHTIGAGAINSTFMFATGVITANNIANNTLTTTQISGTAGITGAQLANGTLTDTQVSSSAAINRTKLASATLANVKITSNITNLTSNTAADIAGLTTTQTTTGTRNYLCNAKVAFTLTTGSNCGVFLYLVRDGVQIDQTEGVIGANSTTLTLTLAFLDQGVAAGSHTWKLQYSLGIGGDAVVAIGSSSNPSYLNITDVT